MIVESLWVHEGPLSKNIHVPGLDAQAPPAQKQHDPDAQTTSMLEHAGGGPGIWVATQMPEPPR